VREEQAIVISLVVVVLAGISVLWMSIHYRKRIREMAHRERLAMIDRGLVPPPEVDPARFERQAGLEPPLSRGAERSRSVGIVMIGLGLAFMVLISIAAEAPEAGVGIGGAFAVLGAAFLFNSMLLDRRRSHEPSRAPDYPRRSAVEPPTRDPGA
jgi:hypothetical protein